MSVDVLIVDDDPDIRMTIAELLRDEGYDVGEVGDARELGESLERDDPRLVLLDLTMPGFSADVELARLRDEGLLDDRVVLALSGRDDTPGIATRLGLQGAITKPFDIDDLLRHVAEVCRPPPMHEPPAPAP